MCFNIIGTSGGMPVWERSIQFTRSVNSHTVPSFIVLHHRKSAPLVYVEGYRSCDSTFIDLHTKRLDKLPKSHLAPTGRAIPSVSQIKSSQATIMDVAVCLVTT